jgi:hypothetical protein
MVGCASFLRALGVSQILVFGISLQLVAGKRQVSGPPLVGIKVDAFDVDRGIALPSVSGPDGVGSPVLWGDAEPQPARPLPLREPKTRRRRRRQRANQRPASESDAPPPAPATSPPPAPAAVPSASLRGVSVDRHPERRAMEGKWLIESPSRRGTFYVLDGELGVPCGPVPESWYQEHATSELVCALRPWRSPCPFDVCLTWFELYVISGERRARSQGSTPVMCMCDSCAGQDRRMNTLYLLVSRAGTKLILAEYKHS